MISNKNETHPNEIQVTAISSVALLAAKCCGGEYRPAQALLQRLTSLTASIVIAVHNSNDERPVHQMFA